MEKKDDTNQIKLINQALSAAISSINLAKQLLVEVVGVRSSAILPTNVSRASAAPESLSAQLPGVIGTFDGQSMVTADGQKFQIPENYASKSMIVFGDKLKMVEVNGEKRFKQIERTKRQRAVGMVVKKEGRYHVVTSDGSYRVSSAAISFFGVKEGDEVHIILPLNNKHVPYAALESVSTKKEVEEAKIAHIPTESQAVKERPVGTAKAASKEVVKESGKKESEFVKKIAKVSKGKEKIAVDKPAEKIINVKEKPGIERKEEKPIAPLIGDDELR